MVIALHQESVGGLNVEQEVPKRVPIFGNITPNQS